ncbi:hypothetical protein NP233_g11658 [Leucocoprinus birnbaumii]|uniref:Carboxylic ester hydrolase n=1 Tax=Leucocoprinus birnbaumii TaxID=56174 RepID=A0AAD5VLS3_9AGAR|nr:hypothetical protein NP233_g11658 [Leucocoprinus birnbaumii]
MWGAERPDSSHSFVKVIEGKEEAVWTLCASAQLIVHTQQGDVIGTLAGPTVRQFLGIPYATARRWTAPKSPPRRVTPLLANKFGDSCIQNNGPANIEFLKLTGSVVPNATESEDCLTVNIWAPSLSRKQRTAVMIWIYGGGFVFGTSNLPTYNGQFIVRDNEDVTVVTFNYRLDIFGQPNAPQLLNSTNGSQNFGLLDIDAAVNWVHDNIANFGGDPNRIILFGQSAGGAATDAYTFAHPDSTIVKGVIEHSGSISLVGGLPIISPASWNNVSSAVGCGTTADAAQLACMKKVPGRTLEDAVVSTGAAFGLVQDNITIFSDTAARAAAGNFLKVPLLVGSTQNEGDIFVVGAELLSPLASAPPFVTELAADLETHLGFTCPAGANALNRLGAGVPTWRYQYQAVFRDISTRPDLRAWHASELPIVFGTYNQSTAIPKTQDEIALSRYMQSAWVAFARDPQKGLSNFGWPAYNPTSQSLVQLGNFFNRSSATFGSAAQIDFACNKAQTLAVIAAEVNSLLAP